jgi:hypothetical protein
MLRAPRQLTMMTITTTLANHTLLTSAHCYLVTGIYLALHGIDGVTGPLRAVGPHVFACPDPAEFRDEVSLSVLSLEGAFGDMTSWTHETMAWDGASAHWQTGATM